MTALPKLIRVGLCAVFCGLVSTDAATTTPKISMDVLDDHRLIQAGDKVSIKILDERREAYQPVVPQNGVIEVPYIGRTKAAGVTCRKLAYAISSRLLSVPVDALPFRRSASPLVIVATDNVTPPCMKDLDHSTKLRSGDSVTIRIVEDKHGTLRQLVSTTGEIHAPYLGLLKAEGLTCRELAHHMKAGLEKEVFKKATVIVFREGEHEAEDVEERFCELEFVVIFGAIAKQGKFDLVSNPDLTVTGLLKLAGGLTSKDSAARIWIVRKTPQGNERILVNAKAILVKKRSEYDLFLRPDDVVIVE
jgi:protein involved in polysaccharide export with SLBB domain